MNICHMGANLSMACLSCRVSGSSNRRQLRRNEKRPSDIAARYRGAAVAGFHISLVDKWLSIWQPLKIQIPSIARTSAGVVLWKVPVIFRYFTASASIRMFVHVTISSMICSSKNNVKHFSGMSAFDASGVGPGVKAGIVQLSW